MKFACLVYVDSETIGALTPEQSRALTDATIDLDWDLRRSGRFILGQPLQSPDTAVTLRIRNGKLSRTDGPFAETREFLGGFFLIEANDLEEALAIAGRSPMAAMGSIEVRPFLEQTHSVTGSRRPPY